MEKSFRQYITEDAGGFSGFVARQLDRLYKAAGAGVLALGIIGYGAAKADKAYAQCSPPSLPINYWDSPTGCGTCAPGISGAYRDGLLFIDGAAVDLMLDADNDLSTPADPFFRGRETNVNSSAFPVTLGGGAYNIDVYEETSTVPGFDTSCEPPYPDFSRQAGDARIGGNIAFPRDLAFLVPGSSIQQRLDTYPLRLNVLADTITIDWSTGPVTNPEAGYWDVIRIDGDLRSVGGVGGATAIPVACNTLATSVSGTPELLANPAPNSVFYYSIRPRDLGGITPGNYGLQDTTLGLAGGTTRPDPLGGCPP
jgi:hypothetical protein